MENAAALRNTRPNPYAGPRSFEAGETLYGRDAETSDLVSLLCAERIVLLHSPSGAGKTSLIQAVLVASMAERGFFTRPVARANREAAQPPAEGYNRYIFSVLSWLESAFPAAEQIPEKELAGMTLAAYLARRPRPTGESFELFIFDQFEEIITLNPADQAAKTAFFAQLGRLLADDTRWALFSMREDMLGALDPYLRYIPNRLTATFRLDLLDVKSAAQALQGPALAAGAPFEDAAVERLLDDLRQVQVQQPDGRMVSQPGLHIEPVQLQVVAYRLWAGLGLEDDCIGLDDLAALGDVGQALGAYYAEQVQVIAAQTGVSERSLREWFDQRLITEGNIRAQVPMGAEQSGGLDNRAVQLLENAHLIRSEKRGGVTWYELAHDRLVEPVSRDNQGWFRRNLTLLQRRALAWNQQRARGFAGDDLLLQDKELAEAEYWARQNEKELLPSERDFLSASLQKSEKSLVPVQQRARLWVAQGRPDGLLLRGAEMVEAEAWAAERAASLLEQERDFLNASREARVFEAFERKLNERRQKTAVIASIAAMAMLVLAVLAFYFMRQAVNQRDEANQLAYQLRVSQLAAQAVTYQDRQFDLALLLSAEAYRLLDTFQTRNSLLKTLQVNPALLSILPGQDMLVNSIAFSPDGRLLAAGGHDGAILLWDMATRRPLGEPLRHRSDHILSVAFSPDGKLLASGSEDGTIALWDAATRQPVGEPLKSQAGFISSVAFSPDGRLLASGSEDKTVLLWDVATRQPAGEPLKGHADAVFWVAFSPDGRLLASGSADRTIRLWDATTGLPVGEPLRGHEDYVTDVTFSPDGRLLASGSIDKTIRLWDATTGRPVGEPLRGHRDHVTDVAFSPDGRLLASGSLDKTIRLWNPATGQAVGEPLKGHKDVIYTIAFSPDGKMLASAEHDGAIYLWNVAGPMPLGEPLHGQTDPVNSVAFSPDGRLLASGSRDGTIQLWDTVARQPAGEPLKGHEADVNSIAFSPDGRLLVSGSDDMTIRVWDAATRQLVGEPLRGQEGYITSVAFSPDGQRLASASWDGTIQLWDAATGQPAGEPLKGPRVVVKSVAFSPDGRLLASGSYNHSVQLWDTATGQPVGEPLWGHEEYVSSVAFSPDGRLLASGGWDKTVFLWDVASRQPLGEPLSGHESGVSSVAFSPDGRLLASGSVDGRVLLWDAATRQRLGDPLRGQEASITSLAFSPDGRLLASGSLDKTILLWDVDPRSWAARACRSANRNLTQEEWKQFVGEEAAYQKTCPEIP